VRETPLQKILRLSQVKGYTRVEKGRAQQVRPYANSKTKKSKAHWARGAWGSLKVGDLISISNVTFKVIKVNVPQTPFPTSSAGTGVNTGGPGSTSSSGTGTNTSGPGSTSSSGTGLNTGSGIAQAALGGQKVPFGTKTVTNLIQNTRTGKQYYVYLPPNAGVLVWTA